MYNQIIRKIFSENNDSYIVLSNFENTSEYQCIKLDRKNDKIYCALLNRVEKASKILGETGLSINIEVPVPPNPSNFDSYILWKKRNVMKKVIPQSEAVLFLYSHNLYLNTDYDAYQAIDLANEIKTKELKNTNVKPTAPPSTLYPYLIDDNK